MDYINFIGTLESPTEDQVRFLENKRPYLGTPEHDYDHVRFGIPVGTVKFDKVKGDRDVLLKHFIHHGYSSWPSTKIEPRFRKHVALFRVSLDFWEQFSKDRVFDKDEIYFRCLSEGHSFTEKIKKMRSTCYRAMTTETETIIDEEYFSPAYTGYNSIIHERYLIHWDDTQDVDDVKYAFVEEGDDNSHIFQGLLDEFWEDFKLDEIDFSLEFDMIGALKNTKMYDPVRKKTSLMREFWDSEINPQDPYFAKRVVVPTLPGSTRDTGIGTPSTILKVKQLNWLARQISERLPYSANADAKTCNARLKRVLKKDMFLHLDFKKFGLTFPRKLMNKLIEKIGLQGVDTSHLVINDFFVQIDDETYSTRRGTMLGWLDSINSICVSVILHKLAKELKFDFITFNDDVEISKRGSEYPETLELLRSAVMTTIDFFDIPISIEKTFGSRASVFLERYAFYDRYGLDMYKEQLTVNAYARSCVSTEPWRAKLLFAAAEQWTKSDYATDRCIDTCPIEFRKCENTLPLWSGGWFIRQTNGLDMSLVESDKLGIRLGYELQKFKPSRYATKREKVSGNESISRKTNENSYNAMPASSALWERGWEVETIREVNHEVDLIRQKVRHLSALYSGRNKCFAQNALGLVENYIQVWDPF